MNQLSDFICFVENVLTKEQCEFVIRYYEDNIKNEIYSQIEGGYNPKIRSSKTLQIPLDTELDSILSIAINNTLYHYFKYLNDQVTLKDDFNWCHHLPNELGSDPYLINKYEVGQEYIWHKDQSDDPNTGTMFSRKFSIVVYLNDDFEGGETEFQFGSIQPKQGACLIFPSDFMYTHCSRPVTRGVKYSCASWLSPKTKIKNSEKFVKIVPKCTK